MAFSSRSFGLLALALMLPVAAMASCGDEVLQPIEASGGGGTGGAGGEPFGSCADCEGATPVCVDESSCAPSCPAGRVQCHESAEASAADGCCPTGDQCCSAAQNGYSGGDICATQTSSCPIECPDGETICSGGELCIQDARELSWSCVANCGTERVCGEQCCPIGSRCENGSCPLPDITIDEERVSGTARVHQTSFPPGSCEILEGCIGDDGERTLLRFDLATPNIGEGDLFMGNPVFQGDLFEYSTCHEHFHFNSYATYRLLDDRGNVVANGHKQAFCLLDFTPWDEDASSDAIYDCGYQGIQAGWSDVYGRRLPCQWVDITDLGPGEYQLEVELNNLSILAEGNYDNNYVSASVTVSPDSCPLGCSDFDPACCQAGNPCGLEEDGACDCGGIEPWDQLDCQTCYDCLPVTRCLGGCTLDEGPCCTDANSCDKALDGVCDCGGNYEWDRLDCIGCLSDDADCPPVDTCPGGCTNQSPSNPCCADPNSDVCGYALDGYCDCGGANWDFADCFFCACDE